MKLYTSYFYQIRNFPHNLIPLSTVVWPPKYPLKDSTGAPPLIIDCPPLKPGQQCEGLCDGSCSPKHPQNCKFLQFYKRQLEAIDFQKFLHKLEHLKQIIEEQENILDVEFAFIVFESPKNMCSERTIIQQWFKENNMEVTEWSPLNIKEN